MSLDYVLNPEFFDEVEAPLRRIDGVVDAFAVRIGAAVTRNRESVPMRYLRVRHGRLDRAIQIMSYQAGPNFHPGPNGVAYGVVGHAWWDTADGRYVWHKGFAMWPEMPSDLAEIAQTLEACWAEVEAVRKKDMVFSPNPYKKAERRQ